MNYLKMKTPVGGLFIAAQEGKIRAILFDKQWPAFVRKHGSIEPGNDSVLRRAENQLAEYFAGKRTTFDLPLAIEGTPFQRAVWTALAKIPFGKVVSYQDQADRVKRPKAVRAVGAANGKNLFCIVLPCHRVIGSSGSLTGYAGGLEAKEFLLKLEGSPHLKAR